MTSLAEISGLGAAMEPILAGFPAALALRVDETWRELAAAGRLREGARRPTLAMPGSFARMLAAGIALDEGRPAAELLRRHYLDVMPRMRVEQLAARDQPSETLFHTPLDWARLPRLAGALARLDAMLAEAGVPVDDARAPTLAALYEQTYYGGFMPLLYGYPADLAYFGRALDGGRPVLEVIDRYLAAPLVHELVHLGRERDAILPIHLDECLAAALGVAVMPELAFPAAGEDNGLYATPWLAQVGQALVRRAGGWRRVLRAHAGLEPWADVLPPGLALAAARMGWQDYLAHRKPHFLADSFHPRPWLELLLGGAGDEEDPYDEVILADALRAMCLRNYQVERSFRVASLPPAGPIDVDLVDCRVSTAPGPDGFDPVRPAYLFPPATAARLRAAGLRGFTVELHDLAALPEVARALHEGAPRAGAGFLVAARC